MGVYEKVPREEAQRNNCKTISTRWLDTNKGDSTVPNYRSRLVGREIKRDKRLDLFAATPPLKTIKLLLAKCAHEQSCSAPSRIAVVDIKRAYFYAPSRRAVYIEIPAEDYETG